MEEVRKKPSNRSEPAIAALSADSQDALLASLRSLTEITDYSALASEVRYSKKRAQELAGSPCRMATAFSTVEQLRDQLERALKFLETGKGARLLPGRGIFIEATGATPGKLAMLFPGQGSQSLGMFSALAERFEVVAKVFAEADAALEAELGRPLTEFIQGVGANDEESIAALTHTSIAQPAILACDIAMYRLLDAFDITPDLVAGHSLGEYAAAVAAGVMTTTEALGAVRARGVAMANATPEGTDPGMMAAVGASFDQTRELIESVDGYLVPANKNSHAQTIIAGATDAVEAALSRCETLGLRATPLRVSHAFHTSIVEPACASLAEALAALDLAPPRIPIYSNVTGGEYPTTGDVRETITNLLARQVASPVEFITIIESMHDAGARTFIEVGPERALTGFTGNILADRSHWAQATNAKRKGDVKSFYEALARLVALGFQPDLTGK